MAERPVTEQRVGGRPVAERFSPGDQVRTSRADPPHHTRLPRYARGAVGTVVERQGRYPLPDHRARCLAAEPEPVYAVRFAALELFGEGDHTVTVDLWQSYLRPADLDESYLRPAAPDPRR